MVCDAASAGGMGMTAMIRRVRGLDWRQRLLFAEATLMLAGTSAAIKLVPFRGIMRAISGASKKSGDGGGRDGERVAETRWAIEAVARKVPWRAVCFQKGLALQMMLRRRGIASLLHYGVRQTAEGLSAHVWISVEGEVVMGGAEAEGFSCLVTYPTAA